MRKLLVSIAASLAMAVVFAGPASAAVIGSVDLTGGSFEYDENGGVTSPNLDDGDDSGYVLVASGTYENLNLPDDLSEPRNYTIAATFTSIIAEEGVENPEQEVRSITVNPSEFTGGAPLSINQMLGIADMFADLKFSGDPNNPASSGTFTFGFEGIPQDSPFPQLGFLAEGDTGNGDLISGHAELRADVAQAVPGPGAMMLFGLGLLVMGAGLFTRRRHPLA